MKEVLELVKKTTKNLESNFAKCSNQHELIIFKNKMIGKNSILIQKFNQLNTEEKKEISKELQIFRNKVNQLYQRYGEMLKIEVKKVKTNNHFQKLHYFNNSNKEYKSYLTKQTVNWNWTLGKKHLLTETINDIHYFCQKMNWQFVPSQDLVSFTENFELLNIGDDHPAIGPNDSFIVDSTKGEKQWVLRTHCTTMTAKELSKYGREKKERSVYTIGNVYRNDTDDSTHLKQFSQLDVCLIGKNFSIANLKWILIQFCHFIFGKKSEIRFRNSFFPFTEPSIELDIGCSFCQQQGCNTCNTGWIELLGAGIISEPVLKKCQITDQINALAFGIGIERIVMIREKISDIRLLYQNKV